MRESDLKAPEDWRTPKASPFLGAAEPRVSVFECASPLALLGTCLFTKDSMHAGIAWGWFGCGASREKLAGVINVVVPLKCWSGIDLVALDMIVTEKPCVAGEFVIGELLCDQPACGVARVVASDFGEHFADRSGELD